MRSIQHTITHDTRNLHPQHQRHVYSRYWYVVVLKQNQPPQGDYTVFALYWRHPPHFSQTIVARKRHANDACGTDARCETSRNTNLVPPTPCPLLVYPLHTCKLECVPQMSTVPAAYYRISKWSKAAACVRSETCRQTTAIEEPATSLLELQHEHWYKIHAQRDPTCTASP